MWAPFQIQQSDTDSYLCKTVQFLADDGLWHIIYKILFQYVSGKKLSRHKLTELFYMEYASRK
jgi:hypothetical protein